MLRLLAVLSLVVFAIAATNEAVRAAPKAGVASAVKNDVRRVVGSGSQPLALGSDVFTNERIRTGQASAAQILLLDKTTLMIGPSAEMTLDRFVYEPSRGTGQVVLNAVRGVFRFVTGSQNPRSYTIRTPIGTVGIRGTIVELQVSSGQVTVMLVSGSLTITVGGLNYTLTRPGTAYTFNASGAHGPIALNNSVVNTGSDVFPMYGWYFQGDQTHNALNPNIGNIDQLNAIIQQQVRPPAGSTGGGGGL